MVTMILHVAPPGTVTQRAGTLFFNNISLNVPPDGQPHTFTRSCTVRSNINIMATASHMHQRATSFEATVGTADLYQTTLWADPPPRLFDPPLAVASGSVVTWSCTYVNDTNTALTFGESAQNNVMCILSGQYYPVPSNRTTIGCPF
jgi:hypothetical protein